MDKNCEDCGEPIIVELRGVPPQSVECSWTTRAGESVLVYHDQAACIRYLTQGLREAKDEIDTLTREFWRHGHTNGGTIET